MVASGKSEGRWAKDRIAAGGRFVLAVLLAVALLLPTCRKWSNPHDAIDNQPPSVPSHPTPDSGATGRDPSVVLTWQSSDPDEGDKVWFDVFLGTTTPPPMDTQGLTDTSFTPTGLTWATRYYWCVAARDNHGAADTSPLWQFTTVAQNHAPRAPYAPTPDSGATGLLRHLQLSWKGGDPDSADTVTYDVYFGNIDTMTLRAQNLRDSSYTPTNLHYDSLYCWRVVARDDHGASDSGPVWQFRTADLPAITAPDTGERLKMYSQDTITWTGGPQKSARSGGFRPRVKLERAKVKIAGSGAATAGLPVAADSVVVYRSIDDGSSWTREGRATLPGIYVWQVPAPACTTGRVQVRAFAEGDTLVGTSGRFEVYDTLPPSAITVTVPSDTCIWAIGSRHDVEWTGGTDGVDSSVIRYSTNDGLTWTRQGVSLTPGLFAWVVPGPATALARIEVRAYNGQGSTVGTSSRFQTIEPPYPDSVVAVVTVGRWPTALCYDSIDDRVFVALYGDSSVTVLNGKTNGIVARISVGQYPGAILWNPVGNKVYVANQLASSVTVINAATNQVSKVVPAGAKPYALCLNPVNNKVYVANYNDSSVTVIDGAADTVLATVTVGKSPQAVHWNPANNWVYVANFGANSVSMIDGVSNTLAQTARVDIGPCAVVSETLYGEAYVADRSGNKVSIIDATGQAIGYVPVGEEPWAVASNLAQSYIYAANSEGNTVSVIDASNHGLLSNLDVAQQPRTLLWSGQVGKLYVACYGGNKVVIIDGEANAVLRTLSVGNKPSALCWNGPGVKVYVANYDDGTVAVLGVAARARH